MVRLLSLSLAALLLAACASPPTGSSQGQQASPAPRLAASPAGSTAASPVASTGGATGGQCPAEANAPGIPELCGTVQTTTSGLMYIDEKVGEGAGPQAGQNVSVHYTGWLTNGTKFDSSRDRGQQFAFPLGQRRVIAGWDEGVATMKAGGKRRLIIPAQLGYGASGAGATIPPNATLIFDVELFGAP